MSSVLGSGYTFRPRCSPHADESDAHSTNRRTAFSRWRHFSMPRLHDQSEDTLLALQILGAHAAASSGQGRSMSGPTCHLRSLVQSSTFLCKHRHSMLQSVAHFRLPQRLGKRTLHTSKHVIHVSVDLCLLSGRYLGRKGTTHLYLGTTHAALSFGHDIVSSV